MLVRWGAVEEAAGICWFQRPQVEYKDSDKNRSFMKPQCLRESFPR